MARLTADNTQRARELIALYPQARSALIPMLHVAQEQDGHLTDEAMTHIGELIGLTAAEVRGTATFYDMLFTEPVGRYLLSVCTNIACLLCGGYELLRHVEQTLGVRAGGTTADRIFTLEEVECIALCGNAPCLTVNWRFFGDMTPTAVDQLIADLRSGRLDEVVPPHGTLCRVRRTVGLQAARAAPGAAGAAAAPVAPASPVAQPHGSAAPASDAPSSQPAGTPPLESASSPSDLASAPTSSEQESPKPGPAEPGPAEPGPAEPGPAQP